MEDEMCTCGDLKSRHREGYLNCLDYGRCSRYTWTPPEHIKVATKKLRDKRKKKRT